MTEIDYAAIASDVRDTAQAALHALQSDGQMGNPLYDLWERYDGFRGDWMRRPLGDIGKMVSRTAVRSPACQLYSWAIPDQEAVDFLAGLGPIVEIGAGTGYWARCITEAGGDVIAYDLCGGEMGTDVQENHWHRDDSWHWFDVQEGGPEVAAAHPDRALLLCWPPYHPAKDTVWSDPKEIFDGEDAEGWEPQILGGLSVPGSLLPEIKTWHRVNDKPCLAYEALMAYELAGGQRVIYVGESSGGCTASGQFHARIGQGCDCWGDDGPCGCPDVGPWTRMKELSIPQWDGIHDYVSIYERTA